MKFKFGEYPKRNLIGNRTIDKLRKMNIKVEFINHEYRPKY